MKRPNLFILGAAKCGTTLLYDLLNQHPEICMSVTKEPLFFEAEYEKGLDYYWNRYYSDYKDEKIIGEARHRNLYLPYIAERIKNCMPDAKLIVILRNPTDRAFSHWWHCYSYGVEKLSFDDAICEDLNRIEKGITFKGDTGPKLWKKNLNFRYGKNEYRTYIDSGYYSEQIERFLQLFPRKQLKIVFLEDLSLDTTKVISELCSFLTIAPSLTIRKDHSRHNTAMSPRAIKIKQMLKRLGARRVTKYLPNLINTWEHLFSQDVGKKSIHPITREKLLKHYYNFNQELEKLTGRNLSYWNE